MKKGLKSQKNKGMSAVIAYIVLISLALLVIGLFWGIIRERLMEEKEVIEIKSSLMKERIDIKNINFNAADSLKINITLKKTGGTFISKKPDSPPPLPDVDVISVADLSGSMFNQKNALIRANLNLTERLLESKSQNRVGIVAYGGTVLSAYSVDLTNDTGLLRSKIESWNPYGITCICCGINEAASKLLEQSSNDRLKSIIVMSDGMANVRCSKQGTRHPSKDAIRAACDAAADVQNLTIYSIGFGRRADSKTLTNISKCGNGEYYYAEDIDELIDTYTVIAEEIKTESKEIKKFDYIKVVFYDSAGRSVSKEAEIPTQLISKTYSFDLNSEGLTAPIVRIEIYPVVLSSKGREIIGPLLDSWEEL